MARTRTQGIWGVCMSERYAVLWNFALNPKAYTLNPKPSSHKEKKRVVLEVRVPLWVRVRLHRKLRTLNGTRI